MLKDIDHNIDRLIDETLSENPKTKRGMLITKDMLEKSLQTQAIAYILSVYDFVACTASVGKGMDELNKFSYNDNLNYIVNDYNRNLEVLSRDSIAEVTEEVYHGKYIFSSEREIKKVLNKKLDDKNKEYEKKYGVSISSNVLSIKNTDDPINLEVTTHLKISKNKDRFSGNLKSITSVEGLKDPLPYAILTPYSGIWHDDKKIHYGTTLTTYLTAHGIDKPEGYLGATSPLIIKKCPYDPYIHHGDGDTLQNCLKNGYFHESADGSCYLCRLEGKGICPHYGFEVFIVPHCVGVEYSVSGSDHVVFHDRYPGHKINPEDPTELFLDVAHRTKYGVLV